MENNCVQTLRNEKISNNKSVSVIRTGNTVFNVNSVYDGSVKLEDLLLSMAEDEIGANENLLDKINDGQGNFRYNHVGN